VRAGRATPRAQWRRSPAVTTTRTGTHRQTDTHTRTDTQTYRHTDTSTAAATSPTEGPWCHPAACARVSRTRTHTHTYIHIHAHTGGILHIMCHVPCVMCPQWGMGGRRWEWFPVVCSTTISLRAVDALTRAPTHARARARAHTHTHTRKRTRARALSLSFTHTHTCSTHMRYLRPASSSF